jgi:hypothetical protein
VTRSGLFWSMFDFSEGRGLEIGPLDAPLVTKDRADVRYVDVYDQATLRANFHDDPGVIPELIPEIDYPLHDGERIRTIAQAAKPGAPFDWVVASHVLEHVPDLIGWLDQLAELVVDDGALVLAVPDRRYCFDVLRPPTTIGQLLQAHEDGDVRPSTRAVYDALGTHVQVDAKALWKGRRPPGRNARTYTPEQMRGILDAQGHGDYIDAHVWVLTSQTLLEQVKELRALGMCDWRVESLRDVPGGIEFRAVLRRLPRDVEAADLGFVEPELKHDLPDWVHEEWSARKRVATLETRLEQARRRERRFRREARRQRARADRLQDQLGRVRGSTAMRVGRAVIAPATAVRRRLVRRRTSTPSRRSA